jgi:hypothetical protein
MASLKLTRLGSAVTLLAMLQVCLGAISNVHEARQLMPGRPIDLLQATLLKQLPTGKSVPDSVSVTNGRIYVAFNAENHIAVYDAVTFGSQPSIALTFSDDKLEWAREVFTCPQTGALFLAEKNQEKGLRIWKIEGATQTLWLEDPLEEAGIKDVTVSGTGCDIVVTRIYENDVGTMTLYFANSTLDRSIKFEPSYIFPIQAFETKWRTFLVTVGPTSRHVAVEVNHMGEVLRSLPRDEEHRNVASITYAPLTTIDSRGNLFIVDGSGKFVAVIDEDLSHSRELFKITGDISKACIYYDAQNGRLLLCNPGAVAGIDIYNVKYPIEEEI